MDPLVTDRVALLCAEIKLARSFSLDHSYELDRARTVREARETKQWETHLLVAGRVFDAEYIDVQFCSGLL